MRNTFLIIVLSLVFFSCTKTNSDAKPELTFKSVSSTVLPPGALVDFTLTFKDVNGDLDSLVTSCISQSCTPFQDSLLLPSFPTYKKQSGDLIVTYQNGTNSNGTSAAAPINDTCASGINDTCYFRFVVKDLSGKTSDTVRSPTIIILKQ